MAQDIFNQPAKNARNRKPDPKDSTASVNEQIVEANAQRDAADAKGRILRPNLSAEDKIEEESATVKNQRAYVASIAAKIGHDAAFKATMKHTFVSQQDVDYAPIAYMAHIQKLLSHQQLLSLPMGGTTEEGVKGTNERFDKFPITYFDKVEQKKRSKQTSVYRELVEQTDEGNEWVERTLNLRRAKNKQADAPQELKGKRPVWYEQELNTCADALSKHTKWMRQGCSLAKQLAAFAPVSNAQGQPVYPLNVSARLATYKDENGNTFYSKYKKPVVLEAQPLDPEKNDYVSIATFNSIKLKDVNDWDTLVTAMERGVPEGEEDEKEGMVKGIVDFTANITAIHSWIEAAGSPRERYTELLTAVNKKGSDDLALSIYSLHSLLDGLIPHIKERVARLAQAEAARQEQDATLTKEQQGAESAALVQAAALANIK